MIRNSKGVFIMTERCKSLHVAPCLSNFAVGIHHADSQLIAIFCFLSASLFAISQWMMLLHCNSTKL